VKWIFCAVLVLSSSGSLSAQVESSPMTGSLPPGSLSAYPLPDPVSPTLSDPSGTLSGASNELDLIATELEVLLTRLDGALQRAGISLDASGRSLESSISFATISIDSLLDSGKALNKAVAARDAELWIWRGTTAIVLALLAVLCR
jgi:hypothetical protein